MNLDGRSAVVAGGAGGLGSATVRRLASLGVGVVVLDPDTERGGALVGELGACATSVVGDSNDDDTVARAIAAARALGTFSIVVSATGVVIRSPKLVGSDGVPIPKEVLLANLELHVYGPFNLARLSAAAFAENEPDANGQRGVIVQTASISATDGQETMVPYAAAKAAVAGMILPMARDLAPMGVRVCAIAPGGIVTPGCRHPRSRRCSWRTWCSRTVSVRPTSTHCSPSRSSGTPTSTARSSGSTAAPASARRWAGVARPDRGVVPV